MRRNRTQKRRRRLSRKKRKREGSFLHQQRKKRLPRTLLHERYVYRLPRVRNDCHQKASYSLEIRTLLISMPSFRVFWVVAYFMWASFSSFWTHALTSNIRKKIVNRSKVVRRGERVILFPTAAHFDDEEEVWKIPIHGWIFDDTNNKRSKNDPELIEFGLHKRAFLSLLRKGVDRQIPEDVLANEPIFLSTGEEEEDDDEDSGASLDDATKVTADGDETEEEIMAQIDAKNKAAKQIIARRLFPFFVDNHRQRRMTIEFTGGLLAPIELEETSHKNGHLQSTISLTQKQVDTLLASSRAHHGQDKLTFRAVTGIDNDDRVFEGHSLLVPPQGVSVISDIDDTVKISHVVDMRKLIRLTFMKEFAAVPGMADLYKRWEEEKNAAFHFVSSSPWQLYTEIADFMNREGFPESSFHLKSIRLKDRTLFQLFSDPMSAKIAKIESILEKYPQRKFVLVGDTGERDPEVYGAICQQHPDAIEKVFLRDVTSDLPPEKVEAMNEKNRKKENGIVVNSPDRYPKAFAGVPESKWMIFKDASEIEW